MNDNDSISRSALLEIIGSMSTAWEYGQAVTDIYKIIKKQPAIDAVPVVHGKWKQANKKEAGYYCPFCLIGNTLSPRLYRYCYYCGVKMDGCDDNE